MQEDVALGLVGRSGSSLPGATQELSMMADRLQQLVQEFELEAPPGGKD